MMLWSASGRNASGMVSTAIVQFCTPLPVNLTLPLIVTMRPSLHRVRLLFVYGGFHCWVTECYQQVNMSFCHAFCMSLRTLRSGLR